MLAKDLLTLLSKLVTLAFLREYGRYPLYIETAKRVLKYWIQILHNYAKDRYVKKCYNMMLHYDNIGCTNWVSNVKKKFYMKMDLDTYGKIKMYKMKMFPTKG